MNDNPYDPGIVYEGEPHAGSKKWLIRLSGASFVLAILFIIVAEVCLSWSVVEPISLEERLRMAGFPAKAASALCLLGFVLLVSGLIAGRRREEVE